MESCRLSTDLHFYSNDFLKEKSQLVEGASSMNGLTCESIPNLSELLWKGLFLLKKIIKKIGDC